MFQNIARNFEDNQNFYEDVELNRKTRIIEVLKKCFSKQMVILYILSFALSFVSFQTNRELAPFGIAILLATLSNCKPIGIVSIFVTIGTAIAFGGGATLNVLAILLLVFVSILIRSPKYNEEANEKRKLGLRIFISSLIVQLIQFPFKEVMIYDLIFAIVSSISIYVFYKIFANSIPTITSLGEKRAYAIEEVMGASLLLAIAVCSIGNVNIYGYSIRNILCILIVLIMGWKNGILVGATAGITIGSVIGIIADANPIIIATYALSRHGSRNI